MRAALYARVSTEDQAEKYGLTSQVRELHTLAQARCYELVAGGEYLDDGYGVRAKNERSESVQGS